MARISGIDLPKNKRGVIGLTYIYGIGRSTSQKILAEAGIDESIKVKDWNDEQHEMDYHLEVKELKIILEQEKGKEKRLLIKRKQLSNI